MVNQTIKSTWEVTAEKVERAVQKIVEVSHPVKVILFGSYVRGETDLNSDLDILVITSDEIDNPRQESIRIRRALRGISMPMDILVVPKSRWELAKEVPGLVYKEALTKGQVAYES